VTERPVIRLAIPFGREVEVLGEPGAGIDERFLESIAPGAFARSIARPPEPGIAALWHHADNLVLGHTAGSTLRLRETPDELVADIYYNLAHPLHLQCAAQLRPGVFGASFRFKVWPGGERRRRRAGVLVRELLDVRLIEVSVVGCPAYPSTARLVLVEQFSVAELREQLRHREDQLRRQRPDVWRRGVAA
jgi:HK97 family phage prohead protease